MKMKYLAIVACTFAFYSLPASAQDAPSKEDAAAPEISKNDIKKVLDYVLDTALGHTSFTKVQDYACRQGSFWKRIYSFRSFKGAFCTQSVGYQEEIAAICAGWKDFDKSSCASNMKDIKLGEEGRKEAQEKICKADKAKLSKMGQKVQTLLKGNKLCPESK